MNTKKFVTILTLAVVLTFLGLIQAKPDRVMAQTEPLALEGIVSAGYMHTCALLPTGAVDCWGNNAAGQAEDQPGPYTQVSAGQWHTCALRPNGSVDCWGDNSSGQATDQPGPYTRVSAGIAHTCALTPSGAVDCWGYNLEGQAVDQPGPYTQVSAGRFNTCALLPSGAVDCWGDNTYGQAADQPGPYTEVSAGGFHTCALLPTGAVDCWGYNGSGRADDQAGPYAQVSAGSYHTCAMTPYGAVDCWGDNTYGQATGQPGPYTQVSAGSYGHTCALLPSGAIDCWGFNNYGQATSQPGPYMLPENDPPVLANISLSGPEDSPIAFSTSTFTSAFSDANPHDVLVRVKIVSLPDHGALTLNGAAVTAGQEIPASDLDGLVFTPAADWYGTASFAWNASDRQDYAAADANAALTLTPVPDVQTGPAFTVNTTAFDTDHDCTDIHCSLRDAVEAANNDGAASTIELAAGAVYALQELDNAENGLPQITSPITINAHGATLQRSTAAGTQEFRAFHVSSSGTLALNRVTISGFKIQTSGGALSNAGSLTINGSTLAENFATKDGGAISNTGTLTIANSTFANNGAGSKGSAIFNASTLTVLGSTIAGNNSSQGSGAIHTTGTSVLKNTLLVKGASGANCYGTLASGSVANMADDSSCGSSSTVRTTAQIALGALASNGGPNLTMALLSGSAAIDLGNTTACTNNLMAFGSGWTDQRGYNRFADGPDADTVAQCDIGAFEYGSTVLNPNPGVDTEPPLVFIDQTPATPDGTNGWYRSPVSLMPLAIDDSEVIDLRCALDPAAPPASFDDLPEDLCPFLEGAPVSTDGPHTLYTAAMDIFGNQSEVASASFQIDATQPALTCPAPGPILLHSGDQAIGPAGVDASVSGLDEAASTLSGFVTTEAIGTQTLTFTAADLAGNSASQTCTYNVIYDFAGFYPPVLPAPAFNTAEPGSAIPLKFSLAGDHGLDILAEGFPTVRQVDPNTHDPIGEPSATKPAGNSGLSYDPETGWYIYVWKTDRSWTGTAWMITIQLIDGTRHVAYFTFQ